MKQAPSKLSRRTLFVGAGLAGGAAAVGTLLPTVVPTALEAAAQRPAPEKGGGYVLSEHVKRYYQTTLI